jgi:MoCo/4Fe-4S cofactor protein with predicted Tat translocation signal
MAESDRHINFKLMRDHILALQDGDTPRSPKKYWRSLEELADSPAFREFVSREFPQHAEGWNDPIQRRTFIKLMGASLALAGLSGCVFQPPEKIVPWVKQPEEEVPGKPLFYATAAPLLGVATPVLVRNNEGRPTKIEGNPDHPNNRFAELGATGETNTDRGSSATDIFTQASILSLYDPLRSQTLTYREDIRTWTTFVGEMRTLIDEQRPKQGAGIRFLTEPIISPTLGAQMREVLTAFPQARWHQYEPANRDNARAASVMTFGEPLNINYRFDLARRILSLDNDFLACLPGSLRYARDYAAGRRVSEEKKEMNRLYMVETTPTNTGAAADHRWTVRNAELEAFTRTVAARIANVGSLSQQPSSSTGVPSASVDALTRDLQLHSGSSIVIAGDHQPPIIHALAHAMNDALGNVGKTVFYTAPLEVNSVDQRESLQDLINDIDAGRVELLIILGGNPVYNSPVDLKLNFERVARQKDPELIRVHLSQYKDETSEMCHWHIPEAHFLESWGDARSYDGTVSIVQPLIQPLYDAKTAHEVLAIFSDQFDRKPYDIVKQYWLRTGLSGGTLQEQEAGEGAGGSGQVQAVGTGGSEQVQAATTGETAATVDFETMWRQALHDGYIQNTALPTTTVALRTDWANQGQSSSQPAASGTFDLIFRTDPSVYDGRFANNSWLQELPRPLTKITWDNAALISPNTAAQLGIRNAIGEKGGDVYVDRVRVNYRGRTIDAPAWITPGQPDNVVTLHLGYGRRRAAGRVGEDSGVNAYDLRMSDSPWFGSGAQVQKLDASPYMIASTQLHFLMEDPNYSSSERDILRSETLEEFLRGETKHLQHGELPTLYDPNEYDYKKQGFGYAWGMAIDLNNCVGCNACTIACQAENNIPIVGKDEVARSREMHWIRVDTYFKGTDENHPEGTNFMPVPCMHCENAPCEPVCPVHATVHSAEGLNDMVYNRCVGTKYCSNNCPYKVRRFNFFLYNDWETPTYQLMRNPDVSVRSRGVMEKCTFCVQRIQGAKIQSEVEGRRVLDGEIVTACQAVCPTNAIVFGDINDPNSRVSKLKANERNYSLLEELNTKPRTTYLTHLLNPNPEIGVG